MKKLLVQVKDKTKVFRIKEYSKIIFISKFMNVIGIEIDEAELHNLDEDLNIISYHESEEGTFQLTTVI